jgi:hypothetical protein
LARLLARGGVSKLHIWSNSWENLGDTFPDTTPSSNACESLHEIDRSLGGAEECDGVPGAFTAPTSQQGRSEEGPGKKAPRKSVAGLSKYVYIN